MIDTIRKELAIHNIKIVEDNACLCPLADKTISLRQANKMYVERSNRNRKVMLDLWVKLREACSRISSTASEGYPNITRVFVEAIRFAFDFANSFEYLIQNGTAQVLQSAIDSDSSRFSTTVMNDIIDIRMALEWVNHAILRDIYIASLISAYLIMGRQGKNTLSYGVDGFYSRLDLPMPERVFSFDEIEEDLRGRSRDIKSQRRYQAGLEGYHYPYVNEGFYWRELRNEPYSFDDEDNNPYPHRNTLWR